jgi:hypothetical protein
MRARQGPGPIHTEDRAASPLEPDLERTRDAFFTAVRCLTLGLVRGERWRIRLGPVTLHEFGRPERTEGGWTWKIGGGLLSGRPGGTLTYRWRRGWLEGIVDGYWPSLPRPIYRLTQLPVHHLVTRLFLLELRGRRPPPGVPAGPAHRLAASVLDVALCGGVAVAFPRGRRWKAFPALTAGYHLAAWCLAGQTLGGRVLGLKVVSVDGGGVHPVQALVRLVALPLSMLAVGAEHDRLALTEVIEAER